MKYKEFTVQELKGNPSFRRMVRGIAKPEEAEYWDLWVEASDENRKKAKEAISDIVGFKIKSPDFPDIDEQWNLLRASTVGKESNTKLKHIRRTQNNSLRWFFRAVAVILLAGFIGFGTYYYHGNGSAIPKLEQLSEAKTVSTEQGEQKTLQFSNGSKIILNSYSSLTYRLGLSNNSTIEVTLDGEAWFDANTHTESDQPAFAVSTPDGVISDIGTKFLVTTQNQQSRVVLQEGMVEVEIISARNKQEQKNGKKFRVDRGEMVEFSNSDIQSRVTVNPTFYTSWATGFMRLDNTSMKEFAYYVEQQFNVEVIVINESINDVTLNGTVYFRSLKELVRSVSEVIEIPVSHSDDRKTVYIGTAD